MATNIKRNANFVVRALNKSGRVSGMAASPLSYAHTQEQADKIKADRELLNPGKRYIVVALENKVATTNSCTVDLKFSSARLAIRFFYAAPGHGLSYDGIARKTVEGSTTWADELERLARCARGVASIKVFRYSVEQ